MKFTTKLLHGNFSPDVKTGATTTPIYQSTAFRHETAEDLEKIFLGQKPGFVYTRINNPTIEAFERRLTLLEGGIGAVACASGMAAVTLAVLNILKSGEEIVSGSGIFGGTHSLFSGLADFGVTVKYAQDNTVQSFAACINERTRALFVETIGNPKLDIPDIAALAELAHSRQIPLLVDNTVTTPYLVQPIKLGADIVVHSTSKYINGSGNSIGGIIIDSGRFTWNFEKFSTLKKFSKFGRFVYLAKMRNGLFKDFGSCISPFNVYLTAIGLETLGLRVDRACENAAKLAASFKENGKVRSVNYPGLADNPYHDLAKRQFAGKYGAVLTIRVGSKEKAFTVINHLKYALNLANIGDARTLVIHPASTIYAHNSQEEKENAGVYEDLIRICAGLEDIEDLQTDFSQALEKT
ncbi:MAG TPA: acetyl-L-homoserine sulfhydrolase [Firmicutes bacterium]|nr:acetyl-L-homoserine sulfhydrolase [Bacillota bacterium]HWR56010.1 PLP-dependent transferase [Negativicutes bacterium]